MAKRKQIELADDSTADNPWTKIKGEIVAEVSFQTVMKEWKTIARPETVGRTGDRESNKGPSVTQQTRVRARYLLLLCYTPFQNDLKALSIFTSSPDEDIFQKGIKHLEFSTKWYVSVSDGVDLNAIVPTMPAAIPWTLSADEEPDDFVIYGRDALEILKEQGRSNEEVDNLAPDQALIEIGYTPIFVDLTRSPQSIAESIARIKRNSSGGKKRKRPIIRGHTPSLLVCQAADKLKVLSENDPLIVALFSRGLTATQVAMAMDPGATSADNDRSGVHKSLKRLLPFIDPMNEGNFEIPGTLSKSKSRKKTKS
jgi:hypothetical protein